MVFEAGLQPRRHRGGELDSSLELTMDLERASLSLAAYAIGAWSRHFADKQNWVVADSEQSLTVQNNLVTANNLIIGNIASDDAEQCVDSVAVKFCLDWFKNRELLTTQALGGLSSEDAVILAGLGQWAPMQAWREKYSFIDKRSASSMSSASWASVNIHLPTIMEPVGFASAALPAAVVAAAVG